MHVLAPINLEKKSLERSKTENKTINLKNFWDLLDSLLLL